ncbi:hypothetical protein TSOC_013047 [Tetrabaena socialis]|uniref:Uncharacterized protein n=1 Tax=Tetrabaena socialis TaxID=47790 RepID=A0A2J7ZLD3_9CHLO|nr:hypothetical protein TSOC_013047 [Tetrabaena socialis]|eukprot:PNH01085.1 hypothetical protein TSOC_013047 [Tetrabaena socialis]
MIKSIHDTITNDLHWLRSLGRTLKSVQSDPYSTADDIREEQRSINNMLNHSMPALVFVSGFWRALTDFLDEEGTLQVLDRLGVAMNLTRHHVEGEFFRAVVDACRKIQTTRVPRGAFLQAWLPIARPRIEGQA